jgi:endogenous inhibitor of DNA gyrase (YacG/DUF329 family)
MLETFLRLKEEFDKKRESVNFSDFRCPSCGKKNKRKVQNGDSVFCEFCKKLCEIETLVMANVHKEQIAIDEEEKRKKEAEKRKKKILDQKKVVDFVRSLVEWDLIEITDEDRSLISRSLDGHDVDFGEIDHRNLPRCYLPKNEDDAESNLRFKRSSIKNGPTVIGFTLKKILSLKDDITWDELCFHLRSVSVWVLSYQYAKGIATFEQFKDGADVYFPPPFKL